MKLGPIEYKQKAGRTGLVDTSLPGRQLASELAVYDKVRQLGDLVADKWSRAEQREASIKYQEEIAGAEQKLEAQDEWTAEQLQAEFGVDEGFRVSKDKILEPGKVYKSWEVQGVILADVMKRKTDEATESIMLPGYRTEFKQNLEEANVRILAAAEKDAQRKFEDYTLKAEKAHLDVLLARAPESIPSAIAESTQLDDEVKAAYLAEGEYQEASRFVSDMEAEGSLEDIRQAYANLNSEEFRSSSRLTEQKKVALKNRLRTAENRLLRELATDDPDQLDPLKLSKQAWNAVHGEVTSVVLPGVEELVTRNMPGAELEMDKLETNIRTLEAAANNIATLEADDVSLGTKVSQLKDLRRELAVFRTFDELQKIEDWSARTGAIESIEDPVVRLRVRDMNTKLRTDLQGVDSVNILMQRGDIGSPEDLKDPAVREDLERKYRIVQLPAMTAEDAQYVQQALEDPYRTPEEKAAMLSTEDPGLYAAVEGNQHAQAAMLAPSEYKATVLRGLAREDVAKVTNEDLDAKLRERYGDLFRDKPETYARLVTMVRGMGQYAGAEKAKDMVEAAEKALPNVAHIGGSAVLVKPEYKAEAVEWYFDNLTTYDFEKVGTPNNLTPEETITFIQNKATTIEMVDGGYRFQRAGNYLTVPGTSDAWVLPFGADQDASYRVKGKYRQRSHPRAYKGR